jgi:nucleoside-diphosphate-sugar epimerase
VVELGRRKSSETALHIPFDLSKDDPAQLPWEGIDALVHCAYDFRLTRWEEILRVNVQASIGLLQAAKRHGVGRGVFISSLSCFQGCRSLYGRAKLRIEAEALALGFGVVRPGLVWGQTPGGMMGALMAVAAKSRLVPLIGDGSFPQYLVHEEDLARLVLALCCQTPPARPVSAACPEANSLRSLLERVARKHGRNPVFVPVPWQLILAGLKTLEFLRLPSPFRSDSLVGFVFQNPAPDFSLPELPQIQLRPFTL